MPSLTIKPPQPPSPSQQTLVNDFNTDSPGSSSPVAPEYSPITPKAKPALPVIAPPVIAPTSDTPSFVPPENGGDFTFSMADQEHQLPIGATSKPQNQQHQLPIGATSLPQNQQPSSSPSHSDQPEATSSSAVYIPQPPNLPFSSEDSSDAIALRAAISTLQFQRRKAQDDLKSLSRIKALALEDPVKFKDELASGRLKEHRPTIGDMMAILDEPDSDDESSGGDAEETNPENKSADKPEPESSSQKKVKSSPPEPRPFPSIPGPQTVVRMPHVNWDKYGIVGEALDAMHAQQQRWPGSTGTGVDRGREYTPAAPYSPFLDTLDSQAKSDINNGTLPRKDSAAVASTPGATVSEHPMETRSRV